jgi:hypothetical protein
MLSLRAHFGFSTLLFAAGLCLAACSKDEKTALEVDVSLDSSVKQQPTTVTIVLSRGSATFTNSYPWSDATAGTLKATLLLPAAAVGSDNVDVHATIGEIEIAAASLQITITAGKATGPIAVVLKPVPGNLDGGVDAAPSDGSQPDLAARAEAGKPDAGVIPDTRIDEPAATPDAGVTPDTRIDEPAATPDAPSLFDVVQPVEAAPAPDAPHLSDSADAGVDATLPSEGGGAGGEVGWQPVENLMNDPFASPTDIALAVDPVNDHVYVMWVDSASEAVRVTRWNAKSAAWEPTITLESLPNGQPQNPQIGVDGKGQVTAAWFHHNDNDPPDPTLSGVRVSRSMNGVSWSPPEAVTPLHRVVELSLAVARDGRARIAFTERLTSDPYTQQPYSAHFDGTWTANPNPMAKEDPTNQSNFNPIVAISDTDTGIILFTQQDSGHNDSIAASTFAGVTLDDFVLLDNNTTYNIETITDSTVAVNRSTGQGVVVWLDANGVLLRSYSPITKTWTSAENIGSMGLNYPSMVMANDGTITLAWQQEKNSHYNVWAIEGTVGGNWTNQAIPLETDNLASPTSQYGSYYEPLPFPTLAVDKGGDVLALWRKKTQATPLQFSVYSRRKVPGKPNGIWQPGTELARKSNLDPYQTTVAVSDDGLGAAIYYWTPPDYDPNAPASPDADQVFVSLFR